MPQTLKVRAVIREEDGQGKLYPHPDTPGRPGHYVGWRDCMVGEKPEHVIPPSPDGDAWLKPNRGRQLVRMDYDTVPDSRDLRKALQDGCLELYDEPPQAAVSPDRVLAPPVADGGLK